MYCIAYVSSPTIIQVMDPHSRLSQFNQRNPKTGPLPPNNRFMEPLIKASLGKSPRNSQKSPSSPAPWLASRPIATNSRVKQDEKYKKDMYLAFADNALQQKANVRHLCFFRLTRLTFISQGNAESFDALVNQFNPKKVTDDGVLQIAQLRLWISALSHVVSRLERTHSALVEAIVEFPWTTTDSAIVKSYIHFIGMLLSARPEYLSLVLGKITQGFTHR
jgi:RNA polymerase I-specific transcription initiation factor RRN3